MYKYEAKHFICLLLALRKVLWTTRTIHIASRYGISWRSNQSQLTTNIETRVLPDTWIPTFRRNILPPSTGYTMTQHVLAKRRCHTVYIGRYSVQIRHWSAPICRDTQQQRAEPVLGVRLACDSEQGLASYRVSVGKPVVQLQCCQLLTDRWG